MDKLPRFALVVGAVLVLAGGTATAAGTYQELTADCPPSDVLLVDQLGPNESPEKEGVPLEDLSAEQQRVFLDALRNEDNTTGSATGITATVLDDYVVTYQGKRYSITQVHIDRFDCEPAYASLLMRGGPALAFAGAGLMVAADGRCFQRVRRLLR